MATPLVLAVRPTTPSPQASARLKVSGRRLSDALRRALPKGAKVTYQDHPSGLVLTVSANELSEDAQQSALRAVRGAADSQWGPGAFTVTRFTKESVSGQPAVVEQ